MASAGPLTGVWVEECRKETKKQRSRTTKRLC
jgi:hypothetical protein